MRKRKVITAWIMIGLLVAMYLSSLIFALMDHPYSQQLLMISIMASVIIPVLLHFFNMFFKLNDDKKEQEQSPFIDQKQIEPDADSIETIDGSK